MMDGRVGGGGDDEGSEGAVVGPLPREGGLGLGENVGIFF